MGEPALSTNEIQATDRMSTGLPRLDQALGGGLLPGTLTVVVGATGIGKTQMGIHLAHQGISEEGRSGVIVDVSSRGDSQNHLGYAKRMVDWSWEPSDVEVTADTTFFDEIKNLPAYMQVFGYTGQRVTRRDMEAENWDHWQRELNRKLRDTIGFLYGSFLAGSRRLIVDGIEPADSPGDSIQFHLFEYLYHQVVRKDPDWVARDLFRENFRQNQATIEQHQYDRDRLGCIALCTSHEVMLDDLIGKPLDEGDILSNANTLIYMGKTREGNRMGRGLLVAKHRGSACEEEIIPYRIQDSGLVFEESVA